MTVARKSQALGVITGIAVFVTIALFAIISANKPAWKSAAAKSCAPIAGEVVAPAEQLGKAYAAVAAHVKPAVVSIYSEKMVHIRAPEFSLPFGDEFFERFFGESGPRAPKDSARCSEYSIPQRELSNRVHVCTNAVEAPWRGRRMTRSTACS